jgi:hypothetical protein
MIVDLLGPSLKGFFIFCNRKFSLTDLLADQLFSRIEYILPAASSIVTSNPCPRARAIALSRRFETTTNRL